MAKTIGDQRPQKGAWAPGSYLCNCLKCHGTFLGDKRALTCAACAYKEPDTKPVWQPMATAPKDGSRFLAWVEIKFDELDEDDRVIRKDAIERYAVVAYYCFGDFVQFPFTGGIPVNMKYKYWQPLPGGPEGER